MAGFWQWLAGATVVGGALAGVAALMGDGDDDDGPPEPEGETPNIPPPPPPPKGLIQRLARPSDFESLDRIIDETGKAPADLRRSVFLGHGTNWQGLAFTMQRIESLAEEYPDVTVWVFHVRDSYEAIGKPSGPTTWLASATSPDGTPYATRSGNRNSDPPIPLDVLRAMFEYAATGPKVYAANIGGG